MKKFNIKVNGNSYEVEIEEVKAGKPATAPAPKAPAAAPAPKAPAAAPAPKADQVAVSAGDTTVDAPMPGKIVKLVATVGQAVKKGDVVLILEAMKMQNEISAPVDGTLKGFNVAAGQNVKPGEVLAIIG